MLNKHLDHENAVNESAPMFTTLSNDALLFYKAEKPSRNIKFCATETGNAALIKSLNGNLLRKNVRASFERSDKPPSSTVVYGFF
ncbi:hypothetical protein L596_029126 [Steinernema carpocapsae]|uniref:Uncharacterized protein n=1 Tax=Steinernema carpocapsae TaxID=34508 RepID=A0A4U5LTQ5_STECR|nr:hypothetical protein L596_029126 [Steinernema carpocapsae]